MLFHLLNAISHLFTFFFFLSPFLSFPFCQLNFYSFFRCSLDLTKTHPTSIQPHVRAGRCSYVFLAGGPLLTEHLLSPCCNCLANCLRTPGSAAPLGQRLCAFVTPVSPCPAQWLAHQQVLGHACTGRWLAPGPCLPNIRKG